MEGDVERLRDNFSKIKDITRIWRLFLSFLTLKIYILVSSTRGPLERQSFIEHLIRTKHQSVMDT